MGKHYSRKRFNPGQKHALNDKLREAERKRRQFPNFDEGFKTHRGESLTNPSKYPYGQDNDGIIANSNYFDSIENDDPETHEMYYGNNDNREGGIGNPQSAMSDYMHEPISDNTSDSVADTAYKEGMGAGKKYYLDEKLNSMGLGYYRSNDPESEDYTTEEPHPLLVHDFNKVHKERHNQIQKNKLLLNRNVRATKQFLKTHTKPAFDDPDDDTTIGEATVTAGENYVSNTMPQRYFNEKKGKK